MIQKKEGYQKLVKEHYKKEAKQHGLASTSTMADVITRQFEVDAILSYLKPGSKCLEVGCGNGAGSIAIAKAKKLSMSCFDFSPDLVALAKKQLTKDVKGSITFKQGDVLELDEKNMYDTVFTERCIINLLTWEDQQEALRRMSAALKKNGRLILIEAFLDGLEELNRARSELGLPEVPPAYHNLHLKKELVLKYLTTQKMVFVEENNFLSTYFFGSRVLYPALARTGNKDIIYNSTFGKFFSMLPNVGNYSHVKLLVFKKK